MMWKWINRNLDLIACFALGILIVIILDALLR